MKCQYCGTVNNERKECIKCGAPLFSEERVRVPSDHFYYHGFIVYVAEDMAGSGTRFHILLGERYIGSFLVTHEMHAVWVEKNGYGSFAEPLHYKLLRLAIGESEVERVETMNPERKFYFKIEITRNETEEFAEAKRIISELDNER